MTRFPQMLRRRNVAALAALGLLMQPQALWADGPQTVADIPPVASLLSMVLGAENQGDGSVVTLLEPGVSPHHIALRPSQARALSQAAVVAWIGPDLSPGLSAQLEALAGEAQVLELAHLPGATALPFREAAGFALPDTGDHEDHDDHGHDDHGHEHDEDGVDPHAWLSPDNARLWLTAMAEALATADSDKAATYRANAESGAARITEAEEQARALLAPVAGQPLAAAHDALQYYEAAFGLTMIGALSDGDDALPGPARVAALRDHLAASAPACLLIEPGSDPDMLDAVTPEGVARTEIDILGQDLPAGVDLYPALITGIAQRIADCAAE